MPKEAAHAPLYGTMGCENSFPEEQASLVDSRHLRIRPARNSIHHKLPRISVAGETRGGGPRTKVNNAKGARTEAGRETRGTRDMTTRTNATTANATTATTKTARPRRGLRAACCGIALAVATAGALVCATPSAAYANDGFEDGYRAGAAAASADGGYAAGFEAGVEQASHYEGEPVTIWPGGSGSVYAEWHRGDSGQWWATFWTYNWTKVYAKPAPAGCGWTFHCYDADGNWVQVVRSESESSAFGQYGPAGTSSHWQELDGSRWF